MKTAKLAPFADLEPASSPTENDAQPQPVQFNDVTEIAEEERKARAEREGEPIEYAIYRLRAADEAREIVSKAMMQVQQIEQEARSSGYRAGYEEGYKTGSDKAKEAAQAEFNSLRAEYRSAIISLLDQIEERRRNLWRAVEPQVIELVLDLTRRVIQQEIQGRDDVVLAMIQGALRRATDRRELVIRVNVADLPAVEDARQDILAIADGCKHLEIIEDRRVDRGGCVMETTAGTIDARIQTQVEELETVIHGLAPPAPNDEEVPEAA